MLLLLRLTKPTSWLQSVPLTFVPRRNFAFICLSAKKKKKFLGFIVHKKTNGHPLHQCLQENETSLILTKVFSHLQFGSFGPNQGGKKDPLLHISAEPIHFYKKKKKKKGVIMRLHRLTGNSLIRQFQRLSFCFISASSGPTVEKLLDRSLFSTLTLLVLIFMFLGIQNSFWRNRVTTASWLHE